MAETIGFVGLGIMGTGMVRNLAAKGHIVAVWNRTASKAQDLATSIGVRHAATLKELGGNSSILMLCVTNTADVEQVLFGENGASAALKPGSLVTDCIKISPKATEEIAAKLQQRCIGFVDAQVSGGSEGTAHGGL